MTEGNQPAKTGFTSSKYVRMLLVILTALFLFGAPYVMYVFYRAHHWTISVIGSFGSIVLGLLLMWYLVRAKIIT